MSCAFPAAALLTRADRDDAEYLELATRYPASLVLNASGAEGVLVAPRWVLTSARHARSLGGRISVAGRSYAIDATFEHPDARPGAPSDLALVKLRDAVDAIEPAPLYRGSDEAGKGLVFVAHGATGRIGEAARRRDGRARAGINTVDRLSPLTLSLQVKGADEASDLQGVLAPGEEGAAAYIEVEGRPFVAGIYHGDVTVWNLFSRISAFTEWIDRTMFRAAAEEARSPAPPPRRP